MLTKPRFTVNLKQLEVLRQIVHDLNQTNQIIDQPGRFRLLFDQNFGVGKIIETTNGDYNVWIGYRPTPEGKTQLVHWYEWLLNNYLPTFNQKAWMAWRTEAAETHPIDALEVLKPTVNA